MPIASATSARLTLGIDDARAHELFRYADSTALDTAVTAAITRAEAWLLSVANSSYYDGTSPGPSSTTIDELFKGAEEYAAGHFLFPRLKIRRVTGRHAPFQQEGSDRFQELIDVEFLRLAEELVQPYLDTDLTGTEQVFSLGVFLTTTPLDRTSTDVTSVCDQNQAILDEANCVGSWPLP